MLPGLLHCGGDSVFSDSLRYLPPPSALQPPMFCCFCPWLVPHPCGFIPVHKKPFTLIWWGFRKEQRSASHLPPVPRSSSRSSHFSLYVYSCVMLLICLPLPLDCKLHVISASVVFIFPTPIPTSIFFLIYLFIFGCVGSSFLCEGFLQLWQAGATLHRGARASLYRGLSCCRAQAPDAQAQ